MIKKYNTKINHHKRTKGTEVLIWQFACDRPEVKWVNVNGQYDESEELDLSDYDAELLLDYPALKDFIKKNKEK